MYEVIYFYTFWRSCQARFICLKALLIESSSLKGEARRFLENPLKIQRHLVQMLPLLAIRILIANSYHKMGDGQIFLKTSAPPSLYDDLQKLTTFSQIQIQNTAN